MYGAGAADINSKKLWNCLRLEIFQPVDVETEDGALVATQVLMKTLYESQEVQVDDIEGLAKEITQECLDILKQPEKSQARHAIKTTCALISTTRKCMLWFGNYTAHPKIAASISRYVIAKAIPHLIGLFRNPDEIANRDSVVSHLADFSEALRKSPLDMSGEGNLTSLKDETLSVFVVGLKASSSRRPALRGLKSMVETDGLITHEELGFIVHNINDVILDEEDDQETR